MAITSRLKDRNLTSYTTSQLQQGRTYILTSQAGMTPEEGQVSVYFVASGAPGDFLVELTTGYIVNRTQADQTLTWFECDLDVVVDLAVGHSSIGFNISSFAVGDQNAEEDGSSNVGMNLKVSVGDGMPSDVAKRVSDQIKSAVLGGARPLIGVPQAEANTAGSHLAAIGGVKAAQIDAPAPLPTDSKAIRQGNQPYIPADNRPGLPG